MDSLPVEILQHIFGYLSVGSIQRQLRHVCRKWKQVIEALPTLGLHPKAGLYVTGIKTNDQGMRPVKYEEVYAFSFDSISNKGHVNFKQEFEMPVDETIHLPESSDIRIIIPLPNTTNKTTSIYLDNRPEIPVPYRLLIYQCNWSISITTRRIDRLVWVKDNILPEYWGIHSMRRDSDIEYNSILVTISIPLKILLSMIRKNVCEIKYMYTKF